MNQTLSTAKEFLIICVKAVREPVKAVVIFIIGILISCFASWLVGFAITDHRALTVNEILKSMGVGIFSITIAAASGISLYVAFFVLPDVLMEKWRKAKRRAAEKQACKNE